MVFLLPQVCCSVLLQAPASGGAGAEEGGDGGRVRQFQGGLAPWPVT